MIIVYPIDTRWSVNILHILKLAGASTSNYSIPYYHQVECKQFTYFKSGRGQY